MEVKQKWKSDDDEDETDPPEDEEETEIETEGDHDEDDDGIEDEEEKINEREVEIEVSTYSAEIKSKRETENTENEFKIELEVPSNSDGDDIEFKLEFSSDNIVEYIDTDADGMYNESVDQLVQTYLFGNFLPIVYTTDNISGNIVHILNIETSDGVFTSRIYASGEFALVNDSLITPVELKIDIGIHNFPYIEPNSALAMKVKDFTGFFSWLETAIVDGVEKPVKATQLEVEEGEQKLYLNYPRGNEIIHDPKIGVANLLQQVNDPFGIDGFLLFTTMGALTLIGLLSITRSRLRRKIK